MNGSNELSRLLAVGRTVSPPAATARLGLPRLLGALATKAAPLPVASGALHLGWSLAGKSLALGFALGLATAGVASVLSSTNGAVAPAIAVASAVNISGVGTAPLAALGSASNSESRNEPGAARPSSLPRVARAATASAMAASDGVSGIEEELRLMKRAKQEIDAGRLHLASVWLAEHAQRFPKGAFSLERDALSILVQCGGRQQPDLALAFERQHPGSPLVGQLRRQCGSGSSKLFSGSGNAPPNPGERTGD